MATNDRSLMPEAATAQAPSLRADIEATLHNLLIQFRDSPPAEQDVAHFAQIGADVLLTQMQSPAWLTSTQSAALLGVDETVVEEEAAKRVLPAARDPQGQPIVHRRDLAAYRMSQRFGATEGQWTKLTTPVAWSSELSAAGFEPWDETMPG